MTKQSNNCPKMVLLVTVMMSWTPVPWDNRLSSMGFIHNGELSWALFSACTTTSDISESLSKCFHLKLATTVLTKCSWEGISGAQDLNNFTYRSPLEAEEPGNYPLLWPDKGQDKNGCFFFPVEFILDGISF